MAKKTIKDVFDQALKRSSLPNRHNYTFRIDKATCEAFQKECGRKNVSMSRVLEEIIKEVVEEIS